MPKTFRFMRRIRKCTPAPADELGSNHPYGVSGSPYTLPMCIELANWMVKKGYRQDVLVTVRPVARSPENLAAAMDKLLARYREWWGRRHPIGPDREPDWFDYLLVTARCEGDHASHGHANLTVELSEDDTDELVALAAKMNLTLEVTGNSASWLEGKANVTGHACKIEYSVRHLLRAGSTYCIGAGQTPPFVKRGRINFRLQRMREETNRKPMFTRGKLPKPLFGEGTEATLPSKSRKRGRRRRKPAEPRTTAVYVVGSNEVPEQLQWKHPGVSRSWPRKLAERLGEELSFFHYKIMDDAIASAETVSTDPRINEFLRELGFNVGADFSEIA